MVEIIEGDVPIATELAGLNRSVGWTHYVDSAAELERAIRRCPGSLAHEETVVWSLSPGPSAMTIGSRIYRTSWLIPSSSAARSESASSRPSFLGSRRYA